MPLLYHKSNNSHTLALKCIWILKPPLKCTNAIGGNNEISQKVAFILRKGCKAHFSSQIFLKSMFV